MNERVLSVMDQWREHLKRRPDHRGNVDSQGLHCLDCLWQPIAESFIAAPP